MAFAGKVFACPLPSDLAPGARVEVGIRPEAIRVRGVSGNEANAVRVRIHDLEFLGAFCRALLEVEARPDLHLVADFSANLMRDLALAEGMVIPVELPAEALRLFPARSAS